MSILLTAIKSCYHFLGLAYDGTLRLRRDRLGARYRVNTTDYAIFRETTQLAATGTPTVLVIGFRLKLIRSSRLLHWVFQRVCILTTPFWSGLTGFRVKLWMVDPDTKDYLGIYDWRGDSTVQAYLDFLIPILHFFSVKQTVWHKSYPKTELEDFLLRNHTDGISSYK